MRKILATVLTLAMILSIMAVPAFADSVLVAGSYDANGNLIETWEQLEQSGKVGCGYTVGYTIADFSGYASLEEVPNYGDTTLLTYVDPSITHLVIDGSVVKNIARSYKAFESNASIISVKMTDGVETISNRAFKSAVNLEEVILSDSVVSVEESAFQQSGLKSATVHKDVLYGATVFRATPIETVTIEDGVTEITTGMFRDCPELKTVIIPASVNTIGQYAFRDCRNLSAVHIHSTELTMDAQAIVKYTTGMEPIAIYAYTAAAKEQVALSNTSNNVPTTVVNYAATIGDEYFTSLEDALIAAESMTGDVTINLISGTYEGNFLVNQKVGQNLTIKADVRGTVTLTGALKVNGRAQGTSPETLTIENITFDGSAATTNVGFITGAKGIPNLNHTYPHNITVLNCDFIGNDTATDVVAVLNDSGETMYNVRIEGCTLDYMHSLVQANGPIDGLVVVGNTITNSEKALNLVQSKNVSVTGNNFSVADYVVRIGAKSTGSVPATYNITGNTFTTSSNSDEDAAIVLRGTTKGATVNLNNNAITVTGTAPDIAFEGTFATDYTANINAEHNYWGGEKAEILGDQATSVEAVTYYEDSAMTTLKGAEAKIDDKYYAKLSDAIDAINANYNARLETIEIVDNILIEGTWASKYISVPVIIEGNNYTLTFKGMLADNGNYNTLFRVEDDGVKFQNLTIDMSEATSDYSWRFRAISAKTGLTVSSCNFIGNPAYMPGSRAIIYGEGAGYLLSKTDVSVNGSVFTNWGRGVTDNENGEDARSVSLIQNEFNNSNVTVSASQKIEFIANKMDNSWVDLRAYDEPKSPRVTATLNELEENNYASELTLNKIVVADDAIVEAQNEFILPGKMPEELTIKLVPAQSKTRAIEKGVYDIVVSGTEAINQLSTAKLTFENTSKNSDGTDMGYEITGVAPYNYLVEGDTYTFYAVSGAQMTKDKIEVTVGQVKFSGYGEIDFKVVATADNKVIVKTLKDEAEYIYYAEGGLDGNSGKLVVDNSAVIDTPIKPEMAALTIEVDYVHDVKNTEKTYHNMKIEITGLDLLGETIEIDLGEGETYGACTNFGSESNVAHNKHTVVVADKLIKGNSYNVKISGDGYRTAEYTIRMDDAKTLKFWNNVMTNKTYMEEDDATGTNVNFLAGDILPDEIINVYDLSAVVSYFGENPKANANYIQYDLNRDGKIDGLDISILLNSWGK